MTDMHREAKKMKVDVLGAMERASKWMFCERTGPDREMNLWLSRRIVEKLLESLDAYLDNSTVETRMNLIDARNRIGGAK